ncbi:hypothetical protein [Aquisediminimonas sediminicola]|uniref:hypothetical protein n=1 Tax=Alteraquisediminimonas sediminicola TaxID=2676787 RepID=UPI001C8D619F|nr:hypothetical protein [Aquisediminimonas sediminicola]
MATNTLQAESVCTIHEIAEPSADELYAAYRYAKAELEMAFYNPATFREDLPQELENRLSAAHSTALNRLLLSPATDLRGLAQKLAVFHEEAIHEGWYKCQEIVAVLALDGHRLARH